MKESVYVLRWVVGIAVVLAFSARSLPADDIIPADAPVRWWKGNLHTHSLWSDGNDFPEMIAEWYRARNYNFLALSDHNVLSEGVRWMNIEEIQKRGGEEALDKYLTRFGAPWVETRGEREKGTFEVRLKPLNEFRALVEERGKFLMVAGEEISDRFQGLPVHLNASNLLEVIPPVGGGSVREVIANNLRAVESQANRSGQPILVHLNHPNFGWGVTAEDLAAVVAERFFEVYNGHPGVRHLGDAEHPSVERLWDIANTIRVSQLKSPPLLGLATDDSHTYHGNQNVRPGRGWIMVQARHLTPESLIRAIERGEFYASSGVSLRYATFSSKDRLLELEIEPGGDATFSTEFIGTLASDVREVGKTLATVPGLRPAYRLTGEELYVRAVVTSSEAHEFPSFEGQHKQAWTQPIGWQDQVKEH
jgi:hypothetical protein